MQEKTVKETKRTKAATVEESQPRRHARRAQTAIEYVMMIGATVVFISMFTFILKTRVLT